MAVVVRHDRKETKTKLEERGRIVMFDGYADDPAEMCINLCISKRDKLISAEMWNGSIECGMHI